MKKYYVIWKMTPFICISLTMFTPHGAWCETVKAAKNAQYGRLFNQADEREALNKLRANKQVAAAKSLPRKSATPLPAITNTPTPAEPVTLQGYVKRTDGKSTVWVNRQPLQENTALDNVRVGQLTPYKELEKNKKTSKTVDRLAIGLSASGKQVQLKAGQQYDPETNSIKEVTTQAKEKQLHLQTSDDDFDNE